MRRVEETSCWEWNQLTSESVRYDDTYMQMLLYALSSFCMQRIERKKREKERERKEKEVDPKIGASPFFSSDDSLLPRITTSLSLFPHYFSSLFSLP